ncbi:DNA polymerase III subunit epsilon [Zhongshania aliphaticivorans]|uniref:DNA polymerase III subunit epsilon n=1 Tax=Zhongshania aliphaticivorans TaxID=1470434 RepID=A0A5S9NYD2_9GAMM|nr:DNA polymerase III subunit epsilon [Zhongshania aliphaticivorans]CAA0089127.1 DNA polymerase III subunit epsilon [Zhongshania aliphaticivorans]CAA0095785.1 DNA polymerase III subunit epsilon [Zhongshania aliphaticivorans]
MRQIVLDTETTGLEHASGHRIIEIGCVELVNRRLTGRHYHQYINPEREVEAGAIEIHGITNEMLKDKPTFAQIADEFFEFIQGAELIIHNAPFDVGFIDAEFSLLGRKIPKVSTICGVVDTLIMARQKHPGQRNSLDALCQRYYVDNSQRDLHGALLDAEILADVYLMMTGGQTALALAGDDGSQQSEGGAASGHRRLDEVPRRLRVISANEEELALHQKQLAEVDKGSGGNCIWQRGQES